jgi:hypothetical protein
MPVIKEYTSQYRASGEFGGRRASAEDFIGSGESSSFLDGLDLKKIGDATQDVAKFLHEEDVAKEVADAQVRVAQSRVAFTNQFDQKKENAVPGDQNFATSFRDEMSGYYEELKGGYKYKKAQQYVDLHGSTMTGEFFGQSLKFQVSQAKELAKDQLKMTTAARHQTLQADPSAYKSVNDSMFFDIEAGVGGARYLGAHKDSYRLEQQQGNAKVVADITAFNPKFRAQYLASTAGVLPPEIAAKRSAFTAQDESAMAAQMDKMQNEGKSAEEIVAFASSKTPWAMVAITDKAGGTASYAPPSVDKQYPDWYKDLTPEARINFEQQLAAYQKQETAVVSHTQDSRIKDALAWSEANGGGAMPGAITSAEILDPLKRRAYEIHTTAISKATSLVNATVEEQAKYIKSTLETIEPDVPGAYATKAQVTESLGRFFENANKERLKDPVSQAMKTNFSTANPITPITDAAADKLVDPIRNRIGQMKAVTSVYGSDYKLLTNPEAEMLRKNLEGMPSDVLTNWVKTMRDGVPADDFMTVMQQVSPNDKALLAISSISTSYFGRDKRDEVADVMARGRSRMNEVLKGATNEAERARKSTLLPSYSDVSRAFSAYAGNVGELPPNAIDRYIEAATAHYVGSSKNSAANMSLSDKEVKDSNLKELTKSFDAVVGKPSVVGASSVLRPFGLDDATFTNMRKNSINGVIVASLGPGDKAQPLQEGEYSLMNVAGGKYQIVVGGVPLTSGEGDARKPVLFDPKEPSTYSNEGRSATSATPPAAGIAGGAWTGGLRDTNLQPSPVTPRSTWRKDQ